MFRNVLKFSMLFLIFSLNFRLVAAEPESNMYINKSEAKIYDKKINVYGKVILLGGFPKKIFGIQTINKITFQLIGENAGGMEQYRDNFMLVTGFLSSASIFSKYSLAPMSWEISSRDKVENFENQINKQFQNIRWSTTTSMKWNRMSKNMEITLYNSFEEKINILFIEMDIIKLSSGEKKRWYMGVPPEVKPSKEVPGKNDFIILWNCSKLEYDENEEMRFELRLGYIMGDNMAVYKFISQNRWGESWKSE